MREDKKGIQEAKQGLLMGRARGKKIGRRETKKKRKERRKYTDGLKSASKLSLSVSSGRFCTNKILFGGRYSLGICGILRVAGVEVVVLDGSVEMGAEAAAEFCFAKRVSKGQDLGEEVGRRVNLSCPPPSGPNISDEAGCLFWRSLVVVQESQSSSPRWVAST